MEKLYFEGTEDIPEIDFNAETGNLLLEGRTIPEDTGYFYQPVLDWLNNYKTTITAGKLTVLQLKFEYFNTNIKLFLDILSILETIDNYIVYWTARGTVTGIDWLETTADQLDEWGCLYHELITGEKPIMIC